MAQVNSALASTIHPYNRPGLPMRQEFRYPTATLPAGWPASVKSAVIHAIALAHSP